MKFKERKFMIKVTEKYYVEVGKDCCTIYENKLNKKITPII